MTINKIGIYFDSNYFYKIYEHYQNRRNEKIDIKNLVPFIIKKLEYYHFGKKKSESSVVSELRFYIDNNEDAPHVKKVIEEGLEGTELKGEIYHFTSYQGVDVRFALDAYKSAKADNYDVLALICGDSDFVPLAWYVKKEIEKDVCLFYWDIGNTKTSKALIEVVSDSSFPMHECYPEGRLSTTGLRLKDR